MTTQVRNATIRRYNVVWTDGMVNGASSTVPGALVTVVRTGEDASGNVTGVSLQMDAGEVFFDTANDLMPVEEWPMTIQLRRANKTVTFSGRRWHFSHPCDGVHTLESASWYALVDGVHYTFEVFCD